MNSTSARSESGKFQETLRLAGAKWHLRRAQLRDLAAPGSARHLQLSTITGLLILLVIAGICGAIGRAIGGGTGGGFFVSIAIGFVGALLGSFIAAHFHLPELLTVSVEGRAFPILWSIIGASLFVALVHLLSGGVGRRYRYY